MIGIVIFWFVMAGVCAMVASSKGHNGLAFFLYGLLIWPIALVHAIIIKPEPKSVEATALATDSRKCPHCAELIKKEAIVCKHCGRDLPAVPATA